MAMIFQGDSTSLFDDTRSTTMRLYHRYRTRCHSVRPCYFYCAHRFRTVLDLDLPWNSGVKKRCTLDDSWPISIRDTGNITLMEMRLLRSGVHMKSTNTSPPKGKKMTGRQVFHRKFRDYGPHQHEEISHSLARSPRNMSRVPGPIRYQGTTTGLGHMQTG
jgi:hypothetical protein